jgi:hypothetical protein
VIGPTTACETCGQQTPMLGTRRCDRCWELEGRLANYLANGGAKAAAFVRAALAELPDEEHGPTPLAGVAMFQIEDLNVAEWCPTPDGTGRPEQVHVVIRVTGFPHPFVMRFKSPHSIGRFINNLRKHRDSVWPLEGPT